MVLNDQTRRRFKDIAKRLEEGLLRAAHTKVFFILYFYFWSLHLLRWLSSLSFKVAEKIMDIFFLVSFRFYDNILLALKMACISGLFLEISVLCHCPIPR